MPTPTRATAWLSRIGYYLQRTVEVTSRVSQGTVHQRQVGQWSAQEGAAAPTLTGAASPGQLPVVTEHRPPSSSGSARISPEIVLANLKALWENCTSSYVWKKGAQMRPCEKRKGLRRQLDVHEMRMALEQRRLVTSSPSWITCR